MKALKNTKIYEMVKQILRQPVLCAFLAVGLWYVLANYVGKINMFVLAMLDLFDENLLSLLEMVVLTLYVLWIKKKLGSNFKIGFRCDNLGKAFLISGPMYLIIAYYFSDSIQMFSTVPMELSSGAFFDALINQLFFGLTPGITEEYLYRVILMGIIMHLAMGKKHRLALAVGISTVVFGVVHIVNIFFAHAPLAATLSQVTYATAMGLLFGAVYARTRNIIAPMVLHTVVDVVEDAYARFYPNVSAESLGIGRIISLNDLQLCLAISALCVPVALYLLRPAKHHEIEAHWGSLKPAAEESGEASAL